MNPKSAASPGPVATAQRPEKHVHIKNSFGHVDQDEVTISKDGGEEVVWWANGNERAEIDFDPKDTPFASAHFDVPANHRVNSGPAVVGPDEKRKYKYTVKGPAGPHDPAVIIQR
ncbi:MAG TPA: hypothetical protein VLT16_10030 [Candidatus Limnocylindrales bacterium]|nr:hypothetical protein [Candidatus Limnocylindrales bacterium]